MTFDRPTPRPTPRPGIAEIPDFPIGNFDFPEGAVLLNTNENRFGASPRAAWAAQKAAQNLHLYPDAEARPLCQALADLHGLDPECVIAVGGGEIMLPLAIQVYAGAGQEVLFFSDGFLKFHNYSWMSGARPVTAEREGDAVSALLGAVNARTAAVVIDNPGNPTGKLLAPAMIRQIHAGLPAHIPLMLDEAYVEFSDYGDDGFDLAKSCGNVLVFRTLSKAYALAGLRIGWVTGDREMIGPLRRIIPSFPIPRPSLAGAIAALADQDHLHTSIAAIRANRGQAASRFRAAGWRVGDAQANFLLLRGLDCAAADRRLREHNIFVRYLPSFLGDPALRLTIGSDSDMARVYAALEI